MKARSLLFLGLFTLGCGAIPWPPTLPGTAPKISDLADGHVRLDQAVSPLHYALEISIDPTQSVFSGRVRIKVRLDAPTDRIALHGESLDISEARAELGNALRTARTEPGENGGLVLLLDEPLPAGEATLVFAYSAPLGKAPDGLYRVKDGDGWYAFTQFEPLYARKAFPGFDQPNFKTPFAVTLRVPKGMTALANARETKRHEEGNSVVFTFAETKPLPTYLVAFAVGEFDIVEAPADAIPETPLRLVTTKGKGQLGAYALARTPVIHKVLSDYFDQPHPFDKLDLVAVPNFSAGAMENVGLVKFREPLLLLDPTTAPANRRMWSQSVIAHELAHMWFGNLVTPVWWDEIWLNEAFSTWMASWVVEEVDPSLGADLERVANTAFVMRLDSERHTRAIRQPIASGGDVHNAFDSITYGKGAAVLRMLEAWIGRGAFRDGVRAYIRARPYGSATTDDLIEALEKTSGKPVGETARLFLDQPGTPLVTMNVICEPDAASQATVKMQQTRSLPAGSQASQGQPWRIPVCLRYGVGAQTYRECFVLDAPEKTVTLGQPGCPEHFVGNDGQRGYYRWTTDRERVLALASASFDALSVAEQVALPGMFAALLESHDLPLGAYLDAVSSLATRPNRLVLRGVVDELAYLHRTVVDDSNRDAFGAHVRTLLEPHAKRIGFRPEANESIDNKLLRPQIISPLAYLGRHEAILADARAVTQRFLRDPKSVSGEEATLFLYMSAWDGDATLWTQLRDATIATRDPVIRVGLIKALGSFRNPTLLIKSLELVLNGTLRAQDFGTLRRGIGPSTQDAAWMWMTRNYDALIEKMGSSYRPYVPWMAHGFCKPGDAERVTRFFAKADRAPSGTKRNLGQVTERIERCVQMRKHLMSPLNTWLGVPNKAAPARPSPGTLEETTTSIQTSTPSAQVVPEKEAPSSKARPKKALTPAP